MHPNHHLARDLAAAIAADRHREAARARAAAAAPSADRPAPGRPPRARGAVRLLHRLRRDAVRP